MPEPFSHEHEAPVDPITSDFASLADCPRKFFFRFRRQDFVGVENENPLIPKPQIFQRPVFFLGPGTVELKLRDLRPVASCDLDRPVSTLRINHENFVGPGNRIKTARQIAGFVFDR